MDDAALLIVDVQVDFCPGGSLPVPAGDLVAVRINRLIAALAAGRLPIIASRDWHPAETGHFRGWGGAWPVHCVCDTRGAAFHPDMHLPGDAVVVSKGVRPGDDGYSAFEAAADDGSSLEQVLAGRAVRSLFICGLATDYCVRATVLQALEKGYRVSVVADAVAGVDVAPGDSVRAIMEMADAGALFAALPDLEHRVR